MRAVLGIMQQCTIKGGMLERHVLCHICVMTYMHGHVLESCSKNTGNRRINIAVWHDLQVLCML